MCYATRNVYTVCAHSTVGEIVECKLQRARSEQLQDGGWCATLRLYLRSCRPAEKTEVKYRFCDDCRRFYYHKGYYNINTLDAVLNYWAFKSARAYAVGVHPETVPPELVFGRPASALQDPRQARCELLALDKVLPRKPFGSQIEWLERLEHERKLTLLVAEGMSRAKERCRRGQTAGDDVVRMQPRLSSPMSVYPYGDALGSITETGKRRDTAQEVGPTQDGARAPRQVHLETLKRLCGEAPSHSLPVHPGGAASGGVDSPGLMWRKTAPEPPVSPPLDHEHELRGPAYIPSMAAPLTFSLTMRQHQQRKDPPVELAELPGRETGGSSEATHQDCSPPITSKSLDRSAGEREPRLTIERVTKGNSKTETAAKLTNHPTVSDWAEAPEYPHQTSNQTAGVRGSLRGLGGSACKVTNELTDIDQNKPERNPVRDRHEVSAAGEDEGPNLTSRFSLDSSVADATEVSQSALEDYNAPAATDESDALTEANMTSRFFVSDIDPDEAVKKARSGSAHSGPCSPRVTQASELSQPEADMTASGSTASPNGKSVVGVMAPEIVAPQPKHFPLQFGFVTDSNEGVPVAA